MDSTNNIERREFLKNSAKSVAVCACGAALASMLSSCEYYTALVPPSQGIEKLVEISPNNPLLIYPRGITFKIFQQNIGYAIKIRFPDVNYGIPLILVRMEDYSISCFSSLCTHDNCFGDDVLEPRGYKVIDGKKSNPVIQCGCHGSQFDTFQNGKAVVGPAERPLKQFPTQFNPETNILTIKF